MARDPRCPDCGREGRYRDTVIRPLAHLPVPGYPLVLRHRPDILAFFEHHASNGPTEAINGPLEALRRNAPGFRNLTNYYRWRSLLHSGARSCPSRGVNDDGRRFL